MRYAWRNFRNEVPTVVMRIGRPGPIDQGRGKSGGTGPSVWLGRQMTGPGTFLGDGKWWGVNNVRVETFA